MPYDFILIGKKIAVFRDSCFSLHSFKVENAKIDCFGEKMILSAFLIELRCRWLQSGLADLEKHQTLAFLLMVVFLSILKYYIFLDF